jgi:hypothetical protein
MKQLIFLIALATLACANRESKLEQNEPIKPCSCDGKPFFKVLKIQQVPNSNFINISSALAKRIKLSGKY